MSLSKYIECSIKLDPLQELVLKDFEFFSNMLNENFFINFTKKIFNKRMSVYGIYLYGAVGTGKTTLLKAFFDGLIIKKLFIHYHHFMEIVHKKIHVLGNKSQDELLDKLSYDMRREFIVLCIDELDVKDMADAAILLNLFTKLTKKGCFIAITSNCKPDFLYIDAPHRELLLEFINLINNNFFVTTLPDKKDYRLINLAKITNKRIFYPFTLENKQYINEIKDKICKKNDYYPAKISLFGREITFKRTYKKTLFTNFNELCKQNLGYPDYNHICRNFDVIFLDCESNTNSPDVTICDLAIGPFTDLENDIVVRFINFIDNAYFYRVLLFCILGSEPEKLYVQGRFIDNFARTISRLREMNGMNYLR